jgi:hypothetical protein
MVDQGGGYARVCGEFFIGGRVPDTAKRTSRGFRQMGEKATIWYPRVSEPEQQDQEVGEEIRRAGENSG